MKHKRDFVLNQGGLKTSSPAECARLVKAILAESAKHKAQPFQTRYHRKRWSADLIASRIPPGQFWGGGHVFGLCSVVSVLVAVLDNKQQTTNNRQQTTNNEEQTTSNTQQTTNNNRQQTINNTCFSAHTPTHTNP